MPSLPDSVSSHKFLTRHVRAGLSHAAASRLQIGRFHCSPVLRTHICGIPARRRSASLIRADVPTPEAVSVSSTLRSLVVTNSRPDVYSPPTVRPSMRIVGAATEPRNSRSLAISEMLKNRSFKFPATVISSTG